MFGVFGCAATALSRTRRERRDALPRLPPGWHAQRSATASTRAPPARSSSRCRSAGLTTERPQLQLVSLPESAVDWPRTEAYAEAARARQFTETRGEADFSRLSEEVAATLSQIAFTEDPARRLAIADRARRTLADWPARNYGYRAGRCRAAGRAARRGRLGAARRGRAVALRSEPRGQCRRRRPRSPMLPPPTLRESVEQAFVLARGSQDAAERAALLRGDHRCAGAAVARRRLGRGAAGAGQRGTDHDHQTDQAYARLSGADAARRPTSVRARRTSRAWRRCIRDVLEADDRLGRQRPQRDGRAAGDARRAARRGAAAAAGERIGGASQQGIVRGYSARRGRRSTCSAGRARRSSQIRQLAGPSAGACCRTAEERRDRVARVRADQAGRPTSKRCTACLTNALQMALRAADSRTAAVAGNDMSLAWQASSAAAGALMLLDQAPASELQRLAIPPIQ